jgi:hypothetical protein
MPLDLTGVPAGTPLNGLLLKRILWDTIPDDEVSRVMKGLNLPLDSPDVADMEQADAAARLQRMSPLIGWSTTLAALAASINAEYFQQQAMDLNDERDRITFAQKVTVGVLAELLDTGLVAYGPAMGGH